jgi:hypothetical protein
MVQSRCKKNGVGLCLDPAMRVGQASGPAETLQADFFDVFSANVVAVHSVTACSDMTCWVPVDALSIFRLELARRACPIYPLRCFQVCPRGYTATLAAELADKNVLVNSLRPGMVDTAIVSSSGKEGVRTAESVQDGLTILQSGRMSHYLRG